MTATTPPAVQRDCGPHCAAARAILEHLTGEHLAITGEAAPWWTTTGSIECVLGEILAAALPIPGEASPLPESDEYRREIALQRAVEQVQTWANQSSAGTVSVARTFEAYLRGEQA